MTEASQQSGILQQLLDLHEVDQKILSARRELERWAGELAAIEEDVETQGSDLAKVETELERLRSELHREERAVDEKRDVLGRLRGRVNTVQNERQYSAATLEFDLVRQDLRAAEDQLLEKMQAIEDLDSRRQELAASLEQAGNAAVPCKEETVAQQKALEEELAVQKDRRDNLALRLDGEALALYDRIRTGRSEVALAPLTDEGDCGNCYTAVTIQQQREIKGLSTLVCCEGCGVILYPEPL